LDLAGNRKLLTDALWVLHELTLEGGYPCWIGHHLEWASEEQCGIYRDIVVVGDPKILVSDRSGGQKEVGFYVIDSIERVQMGSGSSFRRWYRDRGVSRAR
jgi:hypothetical protein